MSICLLNTRFADLKRKLDVVKTKKSKLITILVLMISMTGFTDAQSHDENGEHADHIENGNHTRVAPTENN
jgi:hypothetical protein